MLERVEQLAAEYDGDYVRGFSRQQTPGALKILAEIMRDKKTPNNLRSTIAFAFIDYGVDPKKTGNTGGDGKKKIMVGKLPDAE